MSDQPVIKNKIKFPKSKPTTLVCSMPLTLWEKLLFPHLELVDLIQLERTCKNFAGYEKCKKLIRLKIKAAFGGISTRYWNKMEKSPVKDDKFLLKHNGKFILYVTSLYTGSSIETLGAFSKKERLLNEIYRVITIKGQDYLDIEFTVFHTDNIFVIQNRNTYMKIIGLTKNEIDSIKNFISNKYKIKEK